MGGSAVADSIDAVVEQFQMQLREKIEALTLYTLAQQKGLEALLQRIADLEGQIEGA